MTPRILLAISLFATMSAETFRSGRYAIEVPEGWTAESIPGGVKLVRGAAYSLLMEGGSGEPEAVRARLVEQFGGQWSKFQNLKSGAAVMAGQPALFSFHSGLNPRGTASFLKVETVSWRGRTVALVSSSPEKSFLDLKPQFDQIEYGIRFQVVAPVEEKDDSRFQTVRRGVSRGAQMTTARARSVGRMFRWNKGESR